MCKFVHRSAILAIDVLEDSRALGIFVALLLAARDEAAAARNRAGCHAARVVHLVFVRVVNECLQNPSPHFVVHGDETVQVRLQWAVGRER